MRAARSAHYHSQECKGKRVLVMFDDCDQLFGLVTSTMLAVYYMAKVLYINGAPWLMETLKDSCERADAIIIFSPTDGKVCNGDFATMLDTVCSDDSLASKAIIFTHQDCRDLPQLASISQRVPVDHPYGWALLAYQLASISQRVSVDHPYGWELLAKELGN